MLKVPLNGTRDLKLLVDQPLLESLDALGEIAHQIGNLAPSAEQIRTTPPTMIQCQIDIEPI
jgi:hypothetical protein